MSRVSSEISDYFSKLGKKSAKALTAAQRKQRAQSAGEASANNLSADERSERARAAANAMWAKKKARKKTR